MTRRRILFIGDTAHHEFREAIAWLREYCELTVASHITQACDHLAIVNDSIDSIVVAAARPGMISQHDINSLIRRSPLTPIVGLMGGWCEGEMRTGDPWRGVTRVYWHQFVPRMGEELIGQHQRRRLSVPRTFTEAELHNIPSVLPNLISAGLVVIRATKLDSYEAIAEACQALGHSTVWESPRQPAFPQGAVAAIWDSEASIESERQQVREFAKRVLPAPTLAIIGFPRQSDRELAVELGVSAVVSKPYLLQEVWAELIRVTSECQSAEASIVAA